MKNNYTLISFAVLVLVIIGQSLYFNHRLKSAKSFIENEILIIKDSISAIEKREIKITEKGKKSTNNASKQKKTIDDKLKKDEATIDSSDISDDDILHFLSKYNKG